ncbi:hypothetical protein K488DRAFT_85375 [Vararia minispora EC-137]|uniref:Uncharacterized protein n=1 Tax=Vararia minispora EC-137 TaxID=1314806 RepID=A0ACB8QMP0_9AGAM|nr:hypothetical protein K488DRAFT_85375 [Vararia minispora EC-137]
MPPVSPSSASPTSASSKQSRSRGSRNQRTKPVPHEQPEPPDPTASPVATSDQAIPHNPLKLKRDGKAPKGIVLGLGPEVAVIARPDTALPESGGARVVDIDYVASYDWKDAIDPTIVVPGTETFVPHPSSPRVWNDRRKPPYVLEPDPGRRYVDLDAHRLPTYPLLPLFDAADALSARIRWADVDFILDHAVLIRLLVWARGATQAFRADLERAGEGAVLVQRWERAVVEDRSAKGGRLDDAFTRRATKPARGVQDSAGHSRVVSYDFFGMRLVVRHRVDACLPGLTASLTGRTPYEVGSTPFTSVLVQTAVHARPYVTPDNHVAAYLAGIPYIHVGVVRDSEVQKVHMVRASAKVAREKHEVALEVLGQTLERVHDIVLACGRRGQLSVVCTNDVLKVFEKAGRACFLPDEVYSRFAGPGDNN